MVNANSSAAGGNHLVTSCASDAQNCGKMEFFHVAEQPFREFVRVGRSKNAKIDPFVTACVTDVQNCGNSIAILSSLCACQTRVSMWCGGVFVVVVRWCFCGGAVVFLWWC